MPPLASHTNVVTDALGAALFSAAIALVFLPTSGLAFCLAYVIRRPYGSIIGPLIVLPPVIFVVYGWTCWGCDDHQLQRRYLGPAMSVLGAMLVGYGLARLGAKLRASADARAEAKP